MPSCTAPEIVAPFYLRQKLTEEYGEQDEVEVSLINSRSRIGHSTSLLTLSTCENRLNGQDKVEVMYPIHWILHQEEHECTVMGTFDLRKERQAGNQIMNHTAVMRMEIKLHLPGKFSPVQTAAALIKVDGADDMSTLQEHSVP